MKYLWSFSLQLKATKRSENTDGKEEDEEEEIKNQIIYVNSLLIS